MEPIKRLWSVLDYGLVGLSQEESKNANKDIVQAIEDIDTLKAKAELFDEILAVSEENPRCCRYRQDGFGVMACSACQQKTFTSLLAIEEILSKAKELK